MLDAGAASSLETGQEADTEKIVHIVQNFIRYRIARQMRRFHITELIICEQPVMFIEPIGCTQSKGLEAAFVQCIPSPTIQTVVAGMQIELLEQGIANVQIPTIGLLVWQHIE